MESDKLVTIRSRKTAADESATTDSASTGISRRRFLQILGTGAAATAVGCADPKDTKILPRLHNEDGNIPGVATWFSSTCTECSAGCGIIAKNIDGRTIKVEGNRESPVNRGGLCALGQSSLQSLYDPDRIRQPLKRTGAGKVQFVPISWDDAFAQIAKALGDKSNKNILLTGELSGAMSELATEWSKELNAEHVTYDISQAGGTAKASELVFGTFGVPTYSFEKADVILNFGADFLETWVSPVEYSRDWARGKRKDIPTKFIQVEPRLSLTGANADMWVGVNPGAEVRIALAILAELLERGRGGNLASDVKDKIAALVKGISAESVANETGVSHIKIIQIAHYLSSAKHSLVLAGGTTTSTATPLPLLVAANFINLVLENVGETVHLAAIRKSDTSVSKLKTQIQTLNENKANVLFVHGTNPGFTLPGSFGFSYAARKAKLVVSFSSHLDETAELADLILPANTSLESWSDVRPYDGVYSIVQPTMTAVFDTKQIGDMLLKIAADVEKPIKAAGAENLFLAYLKESWKKVQSDNNVSGSFDDFWRKTVEKGGLFDSSKTFDRVKVKVDPAVFALKFTIPEFAAKGTTEKDLILLPFASVKAFDGRAANRPWLQELPDPITQIVWDSWAEINDETAKNLGIEKGDFLTVRNFYGEVAVPAYVTPYVRPGVVAIPMGQGHQAYGRFAKNVGTGNVLDLLADQVGEGTEAVALMSARVEVSRRQGSHRMVSTSGSDSQHDRELARTKIIPASFTGAAAALNGAHGEPEEGAAKGEHHGPVKQMYQQREHPLYDWGMSIDLAACTGCSACVVACYAENNIPVVGKTMVDQGREMSWLRIERYIDSEPDQELRVSFLPMMCQHCHNAPCEPVCPVYATYHNEEGLNVMVYNRCVGTRYCSNNCSYKVRRFNWVDIEFTSPLDLQLNPEVTKRGMGVMEKCTFCIQRITHGKDAAKDEGRMVRDGEISPACVQSCPTEAITFGNVNDPNSRVSQLKKSPRAYKVLDAEINTQPAISYLEDVKYSL